MTIPEYVTLLRTTKYEQCFGVYTDGDKCCGMGLVIKQLDPACQYPEESIAGKEFNKLDRDLRTIGIDVQRLNDGDHEGKGRLTFLQIADVVEAAYLRSIK